ncbi:ATP-binding protein [Streptomyces mirabilis]
MDNVTPPPSSQPDQEDLWFEQFKRGLDRLHNDPDEAGRIDAIIEDVEQPHLVSDLIIVPADRVTTAQQETDAPFEDQPSRSTSEPTHYVELSANRTSVAQVRDFAQQTLRDWGLWPDETADNRNLSENIFLVLSEFVTNAALYADGADEVRLHLLDESVRIEVMDSSLEPPVPTSRPPGSRRAGHGMFIIQRLCTDWGFTLHPNASGKTVWAECPAPLSAAPKPVTHTYVGARLAADSRSKVGQRGIGSA